MGDCIPRRSNGERLTVQENAATKYGLHAEYRLREGCPAGSDQTGEAEDLASPDLQRNLSLGKGAGDKIPQLQSARADTNLGGNVERLQVPADHQPDHCAMRDLNLP